MSCKVIIDNWSLENLFIGYEEEFGFDITENEVVDIDFLETMVLWDKMYYPNNEKSSVWKKSDKYKKNKETIDKFLGSFDDNGLDFSSEAEDLLSKIYEYPSDNMELGAMRYLMFSHYLGINYFPCPERSEFLMYLLSSQDKKETIIKQMSYLPSMKRLDNGEERLKQIEQLNNKCLEIYEDITNKLGASEIEFPVPVVGNYIINTKPEKMSYLEYALQLRESKKMKAYRQYLDEMIQDINNANLEGMKKLISKMNDMLASLDIGGSSIPFSKMIATISPRILPAIDIFNMSHKTIKRHLQLTFERDIEEFVTKEAMAFKESEKMSNSIEN